MRVRLRLIVTEGLKPSSEKKDFIAALKALRHPKASFSANGEARSFKT